MTKKKAVKKKVGRKSKKDSIDLNVLVMLCEKGLTDKELSQVFDIHEATLNRYKKSPEFCEAIKKGKAVADEKVEIALFQRACGYECPEDKVLSHEGFHTDTVRVTKHYPPETTAAIFWLKNRKPEEWRDKKEFDVKTFEVGLPEGENPDEYE
jgi:hypothetical protein